ncbi:RagB/SusD family nutrient uptake outer membrane protein [Butyricimonas synergistica]|uniref:RagB/SusD family nutrient uptake outer membrane protein n=1 Tax=Butyricimonas synergistica TaxID=544644 RepID=UPI0003A789BA|nr:RagB/SusD family nutrient uptake outer membrane protein [Butyricimonas synergistica]
MKRIYIFILMALSLSSCDDFLTVESDTGVTSLNYWKNASDLDAANYGLYATFRYNIANNSSVVYRDRGLPFDVLGIWTNPSNNDLSRGWTQTHGCINWNNEYKIVNEANLILDNIDRADLTGEQNDFFRGQALGLRAYVYFYMLQNWGDLPLIVHAEDVGMKARTPWQEVAERCIVDLREAISLLPVADELKDIEGNLITSKQAVSSGTCHAILAHLYAWKAALNKEPDLLKQAILECDSVIADKSYALANTIHEVCASVIPGNSREGILECDFKDTQYDVKGWGAYMAGFCQWWPIVPLTTPSTARRGLLISNSTVYKMFPDPDDQRRNEYFYKLDSMAKVSTVTTKGNAYVQKYQRIIIHESGNQKGQIKSYKANEIIIRLADIILLRAECKARTGDYAGARIDLNRIRNRAGVKDYAGTDADLQDEIQDEREREFFCEGISMRYFDCVRNGNYRERLRGKFKTLTEQDVEDGALFIPVGKMAFFNNTLMLQTPYWKANGYAY